ncbi:MAG TPA: hypothetical protein PL158_10080 [Bacillota bacterium]|nr:hypothetical protein [Bacillota bacterium]
MQNKKIFMGQLLHTPSGETPQPIEVFERTPGVYRLGTKDPDMEELVGSIDEEPVTNPIAEEASILGLLRGILSQAGTVIDKLNTVIDKLNTGLSVRTDGDLITKKTDVSVTANTNILDSDYTANNNKPSLLMVATNTAGDISLLVDGLAAILGALEAEKWYVFEIPLTENSTYNLQFSQTAVMQINWIAKSI